VALTDKDRERLEQIERELAGEDPRLARLLCVPGRWYRLRWARRALWFVLLAAATLVALGVGAVLAM